MPREVITISRFDKGIIRNADAGDIPINAASDSENLDPNAEFGRLQSIPLKFNMSNTFGVALGASANVSAWIEHSGQYDLIYSNGNVNGTITKLVDFYNDNSNRSESSVSLTSGATSMVSNNFGVHCGQGTSTPKWVGYINKGYFGDNFTVSGIQIEDAEPKNIQGSDSGDVDITATSTTDATSDEETNFTNGSQVEYALSFTYDNIQESELVAPNSVNSGTRLVHTSGISSSYGIKQVDITLTVYSPTISNFNNRITHINLYRGYTETGKGEDRGFYQLVESVDVNNGTDSENWDGTTSFTITITDTNEAGATYQARTGLSELADSFTPKYNLNTEVENWMFIADCQHDPLPDSDASHMIFRSKPFRYDTFDWANEYLRLPFTPKALKGFNGRLYAFDSAKFVKINPQGMYIEDEFPVGCDNHKAICITPFGMFWHDDNDAYVYDGRNVSPISTAIKEGIPWYQNILDTGVTISDSTVIYDAQYQLVLFLLADTTNNDVYTWVYSPVKKRWDKLNKENV